MTFRVAHWDTSNETFAGLVCMWKIFLSILMASVFAFCYARGDIHEHINAKCQLCTI